MIARDNSDDGWPDCVNVSLRFTCVSLARGKGDFDEFFSGHDVGYITMQITFLLASLLNNTICFRVYDSHHFPRNSIPIVLKTKFIFNVGATAGYSVTHFLVYKFINPIQVSNPYVCSASVFIAKYFSSASNWTELFSTLYRFLRSAFPVQTFLFFQKRLSAYVAIAFTLVVPLVTGVRLLTYPFARGCYFNDRRYCYVNFNLLQIYETVYLLDYWVPIVVVSFVILITPVVIPRRVVLEGQDALQVDALLRGNYVMSQVSTMVFILFTMPSALGFSLILVLHSDGLVTCADNYDVYVWFNVILLFRVVSFSADWIVLLFVSREFRQTFVGFLKRLFDGVRRPFCLGS